MKNLLVTGGGGFIGTKFVYYWLNKYPEDHIVVLDASEHLVRSYHETGIRDTLEWYIENVQWWRNLQKKA